MKKLPVRQVHLDFHTGNIPGIGSKFDKEKFQEALKAGHVNSMTVFGKCHHGYHYYPTQVGTVHPGLAPDFDLSGAMMDACHEIGVRAPLYLTLGWSAQDAIDHPEWIARKKDGSYNGCEFDFTADEDTPKPFCSWAHLCSAGGYRQQLYDMTREACERYEQLDGIFYDIVFTYNACYCDHCVSGMRKMGLNPACEADAEKYYQIQKKITLDGLREIILEHHPDATVFFNSGGAEIHMPQWHYASTHFELEDLPTVWGGYDKMPMRARFFSGLGKSYLGMTGKFHRAWGEFGGYKTPGALKYECASLLSNGAAISVGDQMHPLGILDPATYENIGKAYSYVEQIEDYCFDTKETAKLGVMVSLQEESNNAMAKLLLDCHVDFDVVHSPEDLLSFDTVILPDNYRLDEDYGKAFDAFTAQGGKLLMLGGSGLKEQGDEFAFSVPFTYRRKSDYTIDYLEIDRGKAAQTLTEDIVYAPILCYNSAHIVDVNDSADAETFAYVREPYFNRTYGHYCSHANTPYTEEQADYPAAVKCGNIIYVAHELADMYLKQGVTYHRRYFKWLLRQLYQADCVIADLPCQGRLHMVKREEPKQYVLHLMYASPIQRGDVSVLEDFPTLRDTKVTVRVPETIEKAVLIPQNTELPVECGPDGNVITIPEITAHQMLVMEYR